MGKNKKALAALVLLVVLAAALLSLRLVFMPDTKGDESLKQLSVTVVHSDGSRKQFDYVTDFATLGELLIKEELISGEDGPYGLYILTVDGESVDEARQQWWCLTKGGEQHNQGVDSTALSDGDEYELSFKEGW